MCVRVRGVCIRRVENITRASELYEVCPPADTSAAQHMLEDILVIDHIVRLKQHLSQ